MKGSALSADKRACRKLADGQGVDISSLSRDRALVTATAGGPGRLHTESIS